MKVNRDVRSTLWLEVIISVVAAAIAASQVVISVGVVSCVLRKECMADESSWGSRRGVGAVVYRGVAIGVGGVRVTVVADSCGTRVDEVVAM